MVTIYRRGTKLYLQYPITRGGKRMQRSTGLADTPANRQLLKSKVIPALEEKIVSGQLLREYEDRRSPKAFRHYSSIYLESKEHLKTYTETQRAVERIERLLPEDITQITRGDIRDMARSLMKEVTPKTARKYINIAGAVFATAIDYEIISTNPAKDIALPAHHEQERDPFSPEEVELIIGTATGWFRNYLAIAFYTGARPGEILAIRRDDIDLTARTIRIERSVRNGRLTEPKTRYSIRTVPIFDALLPYVRGQMMHDTEWLFESPEGGHYTGSRSPRHHWNNLMERLDIPARDMYNTRHTFITAMLRSGTMSILEIAQIVGHKNATQIMQSYARFIDGQHLRISRSIDPFADNSADISKAIAN